jgi:hypothetical protein
MKLRSLSVAGTMAVVAVCGAILVMNARPDAQKAAEEARRTLRQQGFKTDLSDFDFSTDYETAIRAGALTNFIISRPPMLLQPCGTESAVVAWKEAKFEQEEGYQNLPPIEQVLATNQAILDSACAAALAGPIHFPLMAKHGSGMLLVHLPALQHLSELLSARMVVELREKRYSDAWTNLLALTRLSTAWAPEPVEVSHLVRFSLTRTAWKAAWQALQARHWTEEQLVLLQHEWEAPEFFKGLPETLAFNRAALVDTCVRERTTPQQGIPLKDTLNSALRSPASVVPDAKHRWEQAQYHITGTYEDERDLLLFFRDRELEVRKAITAPTWFQMRALPGVTNAVPFRSKHFSRMQAMLNTQQAGLGFQREGKGLLGRAAETEERRRLVIVAIALERYRVAHGAYPKDLKSLVPDVLKSIPADFMDGKPLRYRPGNPDTFVLHSVGLDCIDDGGKFSIAKNPPSAFPKLDPFDSPDMVWPRPASEAEVQSLRLKQTQAKQEQRQKWKQEAEAHEQEEEQRRHDTIVELAEIYAKGETPKLTDPKIEGGLLSEILRNKAIPGPPLRLDQLLTLHQVTTGKEPEIATFELLMSYDALTNIGTLRLLCDADPGEKYSHKVAQLQVCKRATNGNCRLIWNTTYDPPGKHFLQAEPSIYRWRSGSVFNPGAGERTLKGPLFYFVSTNQLQFFQLGNVYSQKGAYFRAKLAHSVGSYSLELTTPSGEHLHTITGSTTNGIVEAQWDLLYDGGKRYTNDSLNSTWTVTFPDPPAPPGTNTAGGMPSQSDDRR